MDKALNRIADHHTAAHALDWRKRMSNHVAWSLLVYTAIQIVFNAIMLKHGGSASVLPYFALVLLVAAVIPGWRLLESRWTELSDAAATDPALAGAFARDRALIWVAALGLPLLMTGFFKLVETLQF
ncbi:MAG: hypothetical protein V4647_01280 [Pseudomonadota bacterium]